MDQSSSPIEPAMCSACNIRCNKTWLQLNPPTDTVAINTGSNKSS